MVIMSAFYEYVQTAMKLKKKKRKMVKELNKYNTFEGHQKMDRLKMIGCQHFVNTFPQLTINGALRLKYQLKKEKPLGK